MKFEWDPRKALLNFAKHGVSFGEAATVFRDPLSATAFDPAHSKQEDRFITFGISAPGRLLIVAHTDRGEIIRIISARCATKREKRIYEET
ncbi:MAG: BrnT family toxin [Candidatus Sumerlaeaceae bacterium]|nr:BrnT family toxin [Candidatus Sumerlaeaceae bacterium]